MPASAHKLNVDENGEALEVHGADLDEQAQIELREALEDSIKGNRRAFVSLDDI
jgi:hypothetical protein